ncbi:MAG TPA: hypothetical protein EYH30_00270 [Anaerolineales bacterium]|nr:hypothetical protein [Anaerolineae bacterium]HIQ00561.1 hypothetical protein [Anaerolineales bacterium]
MSEVKVSPKHLRLVKPTLDTPFHINHGWWERAGRDMRVELRAHLCPEHRAVYADHFDTEVIDWVDPRTAEVTRVDGLQHVIREHCSRQPGYISDQVSLVDAVFRVFLANGNVPLSPRELADVIGRSAEIILRTLSGRGTYKGLRPVVE